MAFASDRYVSRRAVVAGTLGTLGGLIGAAMARPLPVAATAQSLSLVNDENNDVVFSAVSRQGSLSSGGGIAVIAQSDSGVGVYGTSANTGVMGDTDSGTGVIGRCTSGSGNGVSGYSISSVGVVGSSGNGSNGKTGVMGISGSFARVPRANTGVYGVANQTAGVGIVGASDLGRGGQFSGKRAQLRLVPSAAASHPTTGAKGDLFVDTSARLWFYNGATWLRVV
jgi:hypothetical protein